MDDDELLLAVLNSTPVAQGRPTDQLGVDLVGRAWTKAHGGSGRQAELVAVRAARDLLQAVVRGTASPTALAPVLAGVTQVPKLAAEGLRWEVDAPADRRLAVRAALAWAAVNQQSPGRVRPCANGECHLFLIDRSKANIGRWCSMARCGNRLKARRHYSRMQDQLERVTS